MTWNYEEETYAGTKPRRKRNVIHFTFYKVHSAKQKTGWREGRVDVRRLERRLL